LTAVRVPGPYDVTTAEVEGETDAAFALLPLPAEDAVRALVPLALAAAAALLRLLAAALLAAPPTGVGEPTRLLVAVTLVTAGVVVIVAVAVAATILPLPLPAPFSLPATATSLATNAPSPTPSVLVLHASTPTDRPVHTPLVTPCITHLTTFALCPGSARHVASYVAEPCVTVRPATPYGQDDDRDDVQSVGAAQTTR